MRVSANPPVLVERDGQWFIRITDGNLAIEAPIGEWFATQFITRLVIPKLVLNVMRDDPK